MDGKICRPSTSCDNFPNLMLILKSSPGSSQCYGANIHAATHSTTVRLSWSQRRNSTCRFPEIVFHNLANTLMGLSQNMNTYSNPSDDPNMPKFASAHPLVLWPAYKVTHPCNQAWPNQGSNLYSLHLKAES